MKGIFSKVLGVIAGGVALFGISATNVPASTPNVNAKSALYLVHGKYIDNSADALNWHYSHESHGSHESHASHSSGY